MLQSAFKATQIVCLEHQNNYLYGEVIQIIESRQLCWMRPLILAVFPDSLSRVSNFQEVEEFWDVRLTSDVAYPLPLFRLAFDMEVLLLIMKLEEEVWEGNYSSKQRLRQFLEQIWLDNPDYFR